MPAGLYSFKATVSCRRLVRYLEDKLYLVANDTTAAIGEIGYEKASRERGGDVGTDSLFAGRKGADAAVCEL